MKHLCYINQEELGFVILDQNRKVIDSHVEITYGSIKDSEIQNIDSLEMVHQISKQNFLEMFDLTQKKRTKNSCYIYTVNEVWCYVSFEPFQENLVKAQYYIIPIEELKDPIITDKNTEIVSNALLEKLLFERDTYKKLYESLETELFVRRQLIKKILTKLREDSIQFLTDFNLLDSEQYKEMKAKRVKFIELINLKNVPGISESFRDFIETL